MKAELNIDLEELKKEIVQDLIGALKPHLNDRRSEDDSAPGKTGLRPPIDPRSRPTPSHEAHRTRRTVLAVSSP